MYVLFNGVGGSNSPMSCDDFMLNIVSNLNLENEINDVHSDCDEVWSYDSDGGSITALDTLYAADVHKRGSVLWWVVYLNAIPIQEPRNTCESEC